MSAGPARPAGAVEVVVGDALAVRGARALVVPANRQLTLRFGSHVAAAVRRRAGPGVEAEARAARPDGLALGDAVLTSAGTLEGFTHLVHAAVLDLWDLNPLFLLRLRERTSREVLARATRRAVEVAGAAGLDSLVLTPMGAGVGGMPDAACAAVLAAALREARAAPPGAAVTRVVVACWRERTAAAFRAALAP